MLECKKCGREISDEDVLERVKELGWYNPDEYTTTPPDHTGPDEITNIKVEG